PRSRYCICAPYSVASRTGSGSRFVRSPGFGSRGESAAGAAACTALAPRATGRYLAGRAACAQFRVQIRMTEILRQTPLFAEHEALGARFVPYAGWRMPVQYRGVTDEHHAVRRAVGLFDVSHMGRLL